MASRCSTSTTDSGLALMSHVDTEMLAAQSADSSSAPAVAFITLGCAKNEVDSADMLSRVREAGYRIVEDVEMADAVIVNTCSFIQEATEESLNAIFELSGLPGFDSGERKIVVAGCMPARYGSQLEGELTEASAFVPCSKEDDIVDVLTELVGRPSAPDGIESSCDGDVYPAAYAKISDGCDRFCAFCAIPFIRGGYHSFPLEQIRSKVAKLVASGVREITLIAQDTGRWGEDFTPRDTTAHLLSSLAEEFTTTWFRLMYIEPVGVTDELLDVIAKYDNVCKYLDMPLQHASARVLKNMNRSGSLEENLALVACIRARVPGITLRTTVMVGFPGETEEEFQELLTMLEEAEFDYVGAFAFSPEEGTKAAKMPDQIDEEIKAERLQEVRDLADAISFARVATRVGTKQQVIVLGYEDDGQLYGRAMCQAPDVDGVTYLASGEVGEVVELQIEDALLYEMEGV